MKDSKVPLHEIILLVSGLIAMLAVQIILRRPPFNDEHDYLMNVPLLHQYGFGKNYLTHLIGSAGPLYSMVHFLFEPVTHLQSPYIRWVNIIFLAGAAYFIYRILRLFNFSHRFYAFYVMAVPITYVIAGMVLTEMPALFFFTAALYLIIKSTCQANERGKIIQLMAGGLCMSLAIIGRQPYLLTLAALPVLFISKENYKKNILLLLMTLAFSIAIPCYVFYIWRGLVPTIESQLYKDIAQAGVSYRPDFFLLCIFYFSVCMLLTAPGFFRLSHSSKFFMWWAAACMILTAANFTFHWIELFPVKKLLQQVFVTPRAVYIVSTLCGTAVILLSLYFIVCLYIQCTMHYRKEVLFLALALLLMAAACAKITWGYSSRYAGQAIPLLILLGSFFYRNSKYNSVRIIIGMLTGLISLVSYFFNPV
jgi:hypothetical protein